MQNDIIEKGNVTLDIVEKTFTDISKVDKLRAAIYRSGYKEQDKLPIEELRKKYSRKKYKIKSNIKDYALPTPDGSAIRMRLYFKDQNYDNLSIFLHGGGFVLGNLDDSDHICDRIAQQTNTAVMSIEYRLAPEFKFPTAYDDALFAANNIIENKSYYAPAAKNIFVIGESSGGNLATQIADKYKADISGQILLYPSVDYYYDQYESKNKYIENYLLDKHIRHWMVRMYLNDDAERQDLRISPILKEYKSKLPKSLILLARHDPLFDEAIKYSHKLADCGTKVKAIIYNSMIHGFMNFNMLIEEKDVLSEINNFIQSHNT